MFHHEDYGGRRVQSLSSNQNESLHEDRIGQVVPNSQGSQYYAGNYSITLNPLNAELNPICHLLALLGVHHFLHVSRIRVKSLTLRLLMSYIYIWSTYS